MQRPAERLHLPALDSSHARHRDGFGLRPATQHDARIRNAPCHSVRTKSDNRVGNLHEHTEARGTRRVPPRNPTLRLKTLDTDRIGAERYSGASRSHDGAMSADGDCRCDIPSSTLGREPVHPPARARHPKRQKNPCNAGDDHELEQREPLRHTSVIAVNDALPSPEKPSESRKKPAICGLTPRRSKGYVDARDGLA